MITSNLASSHIFSMVIKENYRYYQTITLESDPKPSSKEDEFAEASWITDPSNGEKYAFVKQKSRIIV